ncbi:hypothetical protein B0H10DRAFT_2195080 [Mycena sp. CBHHK59/15]|nr:hypothetical protein B0H10DRAFT_2195080 [Mycena sp. CBHHK59/15]
MEHAGTTLSIYDVPWEDLELTRQDNCMLRALSTAMWPLAIFFAVRAALSAWRTLTDPASTTSALAQPAKNWHSCSAIWGWKPSKFASCDACGAPKETRAQVALRVRQSRIGFTHFGCHLTDRAERVIHQENMQNESHSRRGSAKKFEDRSSLAESESFKKMKHRGGEHWKQASANAEASKTKQGGTLCQWARGRDPHGVRIKQLDIHVSLDI